MSRRKKTATRVAACVAAAVIVTLVALAVVLLPNYAANVDGPAATATDNAVNEQKADAAADGDRKSVV